MMTRDLLDVLDGLGLGRVVGRAAGEFGNFGDEGVVGLDPGDDGGELHGRGRISESGG
jgi:hypothetical protein